MQYGVPYGLLTSHFAYLPKNSKFDKIYGATLIFVYTIVIREQLVHNEF